MMSLLPLMAVAETSVIKRIAIMEKLQLEKQYVAAVDTAVSILVTNPGNKLAANFVHDHWDAMMRYVSAQMESNADENDVEQSIVRLELTRQMAHLTDNLQLVEMPLRGARDSWIWYPEVYYNQGDYDSERMHVYRLLVTHALHAVRDYDTERAKELYLTALHYLLPDTELEGNLQVITHHLYGEMVRLSCAVRIPDAIFAYDLSMLSLALDSAQDSVRVMQDSLRRHVSRLYLARAEELRASGDTARAEEYKEYAKDWLKRDL